MWPWWGEAPARPTRASEELTAVKSPDLARLMDAPSRGSECCSKFGLEATIARRSVGGALIRSRVEYPRLGTGLGVARGWDRTRLQLR
jgi:hypothetical protein